MILKEEAIDLCYVGQAIHMGSTTKGPKGHMPLLSWYLCPLSTECLIHYNNDSLESSVSVVYDDISTHGVLECATDMRVIEDMMHQIMGLGDVCGTHY